MDMINLHMNWSMFSIEKTYLAFLKRYSILFTQQSWCVTALIRQWKRWLLRLLGLKKVNETTNSNQMRRCHTWVVFTAPKALLWWRWITRDGNTLRKVVLGILPAYIQQCLTTGTHKVHFRICAFLWSKQSRKSNVADIGIAHRKSCTIVTTLRSME